MKFHLHIIISWINIVAGKSMFIVDYEHVSLTNKLHNNGLAKMILAVSIKSQTKSAERLQW